MGSGLIYAVIIVMWGAYFIPLWLRRHEERSEARSVDRFSAAMRVLSGRPAEAEAEGDGEQRRRRSKPTLSRPEPTRARRGTARTKVERSLAMRRRRVLAALLVATATVALLVPLTVLPWPVALGTGGATLGYLVHLRLQARRSRELSRSRSSIRRRTLARLRRFDAADRIFQARRTLRDESAVDLVQAAAAQAAHEGATADAAGWQPVPVPLPTYVTKPVARRPAQRPVDEAARQEPFDQASAGTTTAAPTDERRYVEQLDELDAMMARRAVND